MDDLDLQDIQQQYVASVCKYKDEPIFITSVNDKKELSVVFTRYGKKGKIPFSRDKIKPWAGPIGFVNEGGHAFYLYRQPIRRFVVGFSRHNVECVSLPYHDMHKMVNIYRDIQRLDLKSIAHALLNEYPTLSEAISIARKTEGTCAFHKRFAVDSNRKVYYKNMLVGYVPPRMSTLKRIEFYPEFKYLDFILTNDYDKTVRTFTN